MRPQGFGGFGAIPGGHDDLGWNDMGHPEGHGAEPAYAPPADMPPVLRQREALQEEFEAPHQVARPRSIELGGAYDAEPAHEPEEAHEAEAYEPQAPVPQAYEPEDVYEPGLEEEEEPEPEYEPASLLAIRTPKLTPAPVFEAPVFEAPAFEAPVFEAAPLETPAPVPAAPVVSAGHRRSDWPRGACQARQGGLHLAARS